MVGKRHSQGNDRCLSAPSRRQGAAADEKGKHGMHFQIIPDSIGIQVAWFDWGAKEVAARLVANLTTIGLGDQLSVRRVDLVSTDVYFSPASITVLTK